MLRINFIHFLLCPCFDWPCLSAFCLLKPSKHGQENTDRHGQSKHGHVCPCFDCVWPCFDRKVKTRPDTISKTKTVAPSPFAIEPKEIWHLLQEKCGKGKSQSSAKNTRIIFICKTFKSNGKEEQIGNVATHLLHLKSIHNHLKIKIEIETKFDETNYIENLWEIQKIFR